MRHLLVALFLSIAATAAMAQDVVIAERREADGSLTLAHEVQTDKQTG